MEYVCKMPKKTALITAGAAFIPFRHYKQAFTLLEVMVVVIIIGILSMLAYSSLMELILTNRAKETAQTIRSFTERALVDAKRRSETVTITLNGNNIIATINGAEIAREALSAGYSPQQIEPISGKDAFKNTVDSEFRIGLSGVSEEGYLVACDARDYCGGAVKTTDRNFFRTFIRKGAGGSWEEVL
jgi:prepilin-type N-terminal cleavage/methylation domain-containing protein